VKPSFIWLGVSGLALLLIDSGASNGRLAAQPRTIVPAAPAGMPTVRVGVLRNGTYDVVTLPMEVYVARVLAGEAARDTPPAALEALAIAVRTYTITNRHRHAAEGFDLCDQTHCQVMRSAQPVTERAALATAEEILLYGNEPATVYYSASCGGRTEKPSNVWPGAPDPSYMPIQDDDGCGGFPEWTAELASADLERALHEGGFKGALRDLRVVARNDSGRVARLALDGMSPGEISGQDLRMAVGRTLGFQHIQSTQFELQRSGRAYRFTGRGSGHGVGMCVIGSMKLAAAGRTSAAILGRYFPGTRLGSSAPRLTAAPFDSPSVTPRPPGIVAAPPVVAPSLPLAPPPSGPVSPPSPASPRVDSREGSRIDSFVPADLTLTAPGLDMSERGALLRLIVNQRDQIAQALGVDRAPVGVRVHESTDAYERASGQPWFTLGTIVRGEIDLTPLWLLRERGMLDRTLRRELTHLMADPFLQDRPAWVRDGAAVYFADPDAHVSTRQPCPADLELQRPMSAGALADALTRARGCFERQIRALRDWRRVR
jgi:SpoIID/LytB domain protein